MMPQGHNVIQTEDFQIYLSMCPRCKKSHNSLNVNRLNTHSETTHKAICPEKEQPILLSIIIAQVF